MNETGQESVGGAAALWRALVVSTAQVAYQKLPESASRLDKALMLVLAQRVEQMRDADGEPTEVWTVGNLPGDPEVSYTVVSGQCTCPDWKQAPQQLCKHRLARALFVRALEEAKRYQPPGPPAPEPEAEPEAGPEAVPARLFTQLHGQTFVLYGGLRRLARIRGLVSIELEPILVTATLAVWKATAHFDNGRSWSEIGDATPDNVGATVAPHFIRMAATRAKARVLREALEIDACSTVELLGEAGPE